jgi:hypothetical protein
MSISTVYVVYLPIITKVFNDTNNMMIIIYFTCLFLFLCMIPLNFVNILFTLKLLSINFFLPFFTSLRIFNHTFKKRRYKKCIVFLFSVYLKHFKLTWQNSARFYHVFQENAIIKKIKVMEN